MRFALMFAWFVSAPAHATPNGYQSWSIDYATPQVFITVDNVSGSSVAEWREFAVTSEPPVVELDGAYSCLYGRAYSAQAAFGSPYFAADLWNAYGWNFEETDLAGGFGYSPLRVFEGDDHEVWPSFEWQMQLPSASSTWSPESIVEDALEDYVDNGGTAQDFLRQDWFLVEQWPLYMLTKCEWEGQSTGNLYYRAAKGARMVNVYIRYNADPDIVDPIGPGGPLSVKWGR